MLGMISAKMMRSGPSPENLAAVTKSRWRSVMICARLARAAPAHDVMAMTPTIRPIPRTSEYATKVMINGSAGMTSATLVKKDKMSSTMVPSVYPEIIPTTSAISVASVPPSSPTSRETRVP